ncbi:MAG: hypothetical protein EPO21_03570 [Chloroflexota bacterium]|nr:MAG: hypothetical protein EPO21_03570 [Chloroflexota bacterium]
MKKRLLRAGYTTVCLLLATILLASCGQGSSPTTGSETPKTSGTTSKENTAAGQEVVLPIGVSLNLTGTNANLSIEVSRAAEMAVAKVNATGIKVGDTVYKFRLIADDDAGDPSKAVTVLNKQLYTDKVNYLFTFSSVTTLATLPTVDKSPNVLQFALTNSKDAIGPTHTQTFRLTQTPAEIAGPWVSWVSKNRPQVKTVYTLATDNAGIQAGVAAYNKAFAAYGLKVVGDQTFQTSTTDFYTIIDKVLAANPDAVSIPGSVPGPAIISQLREKGYKGQIWSQTGLDPNVFKTVGAAGMEGVMGIEMDPASPLVPSGIAQFLKDFQAKYNTAPSPFSTEFYSYPFVLASAITKAQSTDASKLIKVMETQPLDSPWGPISFGGQGFYGINRQAYTPAFVSEAKGGKHTVLAAISPADMVDSQKQLYGN